MLEDLIASLRMMSERAVATEDAIGGAAEIADEDVQKAIESVHDKLPRMPKLVNVRPMYDDPEKAKEAGEDPSVDEVEALFENAVDYVVTEPIRNSGIVG